MVIIIYQPGVNSSLLFYVSKIFFCTLHLTQSYNCHLVTQTHIFTALHNTRKRKGKWVPQYVPKVWHTQRKRRPKKTTKGGMGAEEVRKVRMASFAECSLKVLLWILSLLYYKILFSSSFFVMIGWVLRKPAALTE